MTRPMAALVVAITLAIGFTISPWFFPVGALFYALIVYSSLRDASEAKRVVDETFYPDRARKLDLNKLSGGYQTALQHALDTRKKITDAVAATGDPGIRKALTESTGDIEELVGTIYDIALKAQSLQSSLQASNVNISALSQDVTRLERTVSQTKDEFSKGQYQATLDGKRQQLQNYTDTQNALDRWHAQLDNALGTLDTIFSQVLRIRSSEVLSLSTATDQVSTSLKSEVQALKATSDALDTVYGLSR
ncbi:MAG: hypothetical protein M3014_11865 [Chloroflexota bacterium]|nr:hypothetical protein [Chloroflexota bacterium]